MNDLAVIGLSKELEKTNRALVMLNETLKELTTQSKVVESIAFSVGECLTQIGEIKENINDLDNRTENLESNVYDEEEN